MGVEKYQVKVWQSHVSGNDARKRRTNMGLYPLSNLGLR
jgi:hypothetical protein